VNPLGYGRDTAQEMRLHGRAPARSTPAAEATEPRCRPRECVTRHSWVLVLSAALAAGCQVTPPAPADLPAGREQPAAEIQVPVPELAVAEISPAPDAQDVATNAALLVAFGAPLDEAGFARVHLGIEGVEGRLSRGGRTVVLWPAKPLAPLTRYTVTLRVDGPGGKGPEIQRQWHFRTGRDAVSTLSHRVPTAAGKSLLFRYPYIQSHYPHTVTVVWATSTPGKALLQLQPEGVDAWLTLPGRSQAFPPEVTGLPRGFFQNEASIDGLDAGAHYRYQLLHDEELIAAGIPLKTMEGQRADAVRFVAFGDSGTRYSTPRAVRDAVLSRHPDGSERYPHDFVVGLGDIAYYNGTYVDFNYNFFDQMSGKGDRGHGEKSLLASRPFIAVLGNHEYGQNETATPRGFLDSFVNPIATRAPSGDAERYYSFDSGDAHFVVIDSMKFERPGTSGQREMLAWLDRDLAATKRKWRIAFFHHAIFAHGEHGTYGDIRQNRLMRQWLAPILQRHGVQLAVVAHDHLYQRSKRLRVDSAGRIVRDSNCGVVESTRGIVYLVVGIGGASLHSRKTNHDPCGTPGYDRAVRAYGEGYDFVAMRDGAPIIYDGTDRPPQLPKVRDGFIHAVVTSAQLSVTAYNIHGEVLDSFALTE